MMRSKQILANISGVFNINFSVQLTEVDHELCDLESGDPLFPRDTNAPCTLEIIPVHDNMDSQVQGNWNP